MQSNSIAQHVLSSKRAKTEDGKWVHILEIYYPKDGVVKVVVVPEHKEVIRLDAIQH